MTSVANRLEGMYKVSSGVHKTYFYLPPQVLSTYSGDALADTYLAALFDAFFLLHPSSTQQEA